MRVLFLLLVVAIAANGCDSTDPDSGIGDLTLTLNRPEIPGNSLLIQTEREYGTNCGLDVRLNGGSGVVEIDILGPAISEGACQTAVGPYTIVIPLPSVGLIGYTLEIRKDGETDRYRIVSEGEDLPLELEAIEASFTRVLPVTGG